MKYFDDTAKADMRVKEQVEARRCLVYQMEYEANLEKKEKKKIAAMQVRNVQQMEELKRQMLFKKKTEKMEKEDLNQQAVFWKKEQVKANAKEVWENTQRKERYKSQMACLQEQIIQRERNMLLADHTPLEMQLNQRMLYKIQNKKNVKQE